MICVMLVWPADSLQKCCCCLQVEGVTPLHYAAQGGHAEAMTLLLSHGVDPNAADKVRTHIDGSNAHDHVQQTSKTPCNVPPA